MKTLSPALGNYRAFYQKMTHLENVISLLHWDSETGLPPSAQAERGQQLALLTGMLHSWKTGNELEGLVQKATEEVAKLAGADKSLWEREFHVLEESRAKAKKIPAEFVTEKTELTNKAQAVWAKSKKENDFETFRPVFEKLVVLARREADYLGFADEPYNAHLDLYEKGAKGQSISELFQALKSELVPMIDSALSFESPFKKPVSATCQERFCKRIPAWLGLTSEVSRLDVSNHPFSTSLGKKDKRITTRYSESDPLSSIFGVLHETGHSLYELGLSEREDAPSPISEFLSLGIHESQSRLWENQVGRSTAFWQFAYSYLLEDFELTESELPFKDLIRFINSTQKSKIRVEADQLTYNLHIILRFELERPLLNGEIEVKDLPGLWKEKMKESFGMEIKTDSEGVLQDIHWSMGAFGYFPTYSLGNIYSAQFFSAFLNQTPSYFENLSKKGDNSLLLGWLKKNLHHKGKELEVDDLLLEATKEKPNHTHLISYLKNKQKELKQF